MKNLQETKLNKVMPNGTAGEFQSDSKQSLLKKQNQKNKFQNISNKEIFEELIGRINNSNHPNHFKFDTKWAEDRETEQKAMFMFKLMACIMDYGIYLDNFEYESDWEGLIIYLKKIIGKIQEAQINKRIKQAYERGLNDGKLKGEIK